ncbi:MAG: hypothetical protein A2W09_02605 [Deltaproteobacteria bacterium RBG_16_50_11]|nr:MAG: hypothetical protein A2W09_02605 [Deltaproteobacteria bacterium RBG_16_50_11]
MVQVKFYHPLVLGGQGLVRDTEVAESRIIFGESGDADSPKDPVAFGQKSNLPRRVLFVCPALAGQTKNSFSAFSVAL